MAVQHRTIKSSPALLEANKRLHDLRAQLGNSPQDVHSRPSIYASPAACGTLADRITHLPAHLGWENVNLTAAIRQATTKGDQPAPENDTDEIADRSRSDHTASANSEPASDSEKGARPPTGVKLYPDIGLGMLRDSQAATGRIWLLLRYLDKDGRGWICIDEARNRLTKKNSTYRVCGWRQLRNLLHQGQGIFWYRDKERIWLRSAAKVAAALNVERLTGRPVSISISALSDGIGKVRAHLYASFHSGRVKVSQQKMPSMPIARETLEAITGAGRRSQRAYEQQTGLKAQQNFAIGERTDLERRQKCAWRHGTALFELKDYRGQQGKQGRTYLAWQLPNTYGSIHEPQPKGRQKRINRELADLFMKGMTGNGEEGVERHSSSGQQKFVKHYYANGALAAKAYNRNPGQDKYWWRENTVSNRLGAWHVLPALEKRD